MHQLKVKILGVGTYLLSGVVSTMIETQVASPPPRTLIPHPCPILQSLRHNFAIMTCLDLRTTWQCSRPVEIRENERSCLSCPA